MFRTDFTDKFGVTDLLHGTAKFITFYTSLFMYQIVTGTKYFVLEGRKIFDNIFSRLMILYTFPYENSKIVSVCPYPEKRNHPSFVNISPTLVIDTSMERSSRVLYHEELKI